MGTFHIISPRIEYMFCLLDLCVFPEKYQNKNSSEAKLNNISLSNNGNVGTGFAKHQCKSCRSIQSILYCFLLFFFSHSHELLKKQYLQEKNMIQQSIIHITNKT